MIRLPELDLPAETAALLATYQAGVDAAGDFAAQVAEAKRLFSARNTAKNKAFRVVRQKLDELCGGAGRCCYCELSQPDEVEHVHPKDWFPGVAFAWSNYLYSCGTCNGPKNNQFAIFRGSGRTPHPLSRGRHDVVEAPPAGIAVFMNPRTEDPLDYMELDLQDTFYFVPTAAEGTRDFARADYTIEVLQLNLRDVLVRARRSAFHSFRAILKEVKEMKTAGAPAAELEAKRTVIQQLPHPAVWREMQRQQPVGSGLPELFAAVPEALDW